MLLLGSLLLKKSENMSEVTDENNFIHIQFVDLRIAEDFLYDFKDAAEEVLT